MAMMRNDPRRKRRSRRLSRVNKHSRSSLSDYPNPMVVSRKVSPRNKRKARIIIHSKYLARRAMTNHQRG